MAQAIETMSADAPLKDQLTAALSRAEVADSNGVEAATLRLIICAVKDRDVTARSRGECDGCPEDVVRDILSTMAAQREVSAREYDEVGRIEDAEREREELAIIKAYIPQPLEGEALIEAVSSVIGDLEAGKLKDMGRCMAALKERYPGQIDSSSAGKVVRAHLA